MFSTAAEGLGGGHQINSFSMFLSSSNMSQLTHN